MKALVVGLEKRTALVLLLIFIQKETTAGIRTEVDFYSSLYFQFCLKIKMTIIHLFVRLCNQLINSYYLLPPGMCLG